MALVDTEGWYGCGVWVVMLRERIGRSLSSGDLVSRREADEAEDVRAERRARWRGGRGNSRLIVLFGLADWIL